MSDSIPDGASVGAISVNSPAVQDVHEGDGKDIGLLSSREVGNMSVERDTLSDQLSLTRSGDPGLKHEDGTFSADPAFAMARLTPRMALAPSLVLLAVPSSLMRKSSTFVWSLTSMFSLMRAGPMIVLTFSTALRTPLPFHLALSASRSSQASCWPETDQY